MCRVKLGLVMAAMFPAIASALPSLTVGSASGTPGTSVTLPVTFTNDSLAAGLQFDLGFAPATVSAGSVTLGAAGGSSRMDYNVTTPGNLRVVVAPQTQGTIPSLASGPLTNVPFTIAANATPGNYAVTLQGVAMSDGTGARISAGTLTAGTITVTASTPPPVTLYTGLSPTGTGSITASFTGGGAGCTFVVSQFIPLTGHAASPPVGSAPAGVSFPQGLFDFTTGGCTAASTITITITYPQTLPAGTVYWKYGPTSTDPSYHWYQIPATIAGNIVTFSITDGGLGDDDLAANGTIVDQGGPGSGVAAAGIPTLSEWALLMLTGLMAFLGMCAMQRPWHWKGRGR